MTEPPKPWTVDEHLHALRGDLERLRDGGESFPRTSAFVMLDHLAAIEAATEEER